MEGKLKALFDYQKFEPNSKLDKLIKDVESRYSLDDMMMSDDELGMLNAAGNVDTLMQRTHEKNVKNIKSAKDTRNGLA